jgi:CheY-like chemotaxis protein
MNDGIGEPTVPAGKAAVPQSVAVTAPSGVSPLPEWRGSGLVLLVDDERPIRVAVARMLERLGFAAHAVEDGVAAVRAFEARSQEIRCVLLDLTMPRMNGADALREMRRIRPDVPVVMISACSEHDVATHLQGQPLEGFLQKPFALELLRETLRQVLG